MGSVDFSSLIFEVMEPRWYSLEGGTVSSTGVDRALLQADVVHCGVRIHALNSLGLFLQLGLESSSCIVEVIVEVNS